MNFTKDEIRTSLLNNRYDEVMATYLLLDEKRPNLSVSLAALKCLLKFALNFLVSKTVVYVIKLYWSSEPVT